MDQIDQPTRTCSHVTQHGQTVQTGGTIQYVCESVCPKGQLCKTKPGSCEFYTFINAGQANGKCGLEDRCCFNVIFSKEREKGGKQSDGDQFSVSKDSSISDHSQTCSDLGHRRTNSLNLWCTILKCHTEDDEFL